MSWLPQYNFLKVFFFFWKGPPPPLISTKHLIPYIFKEDDVRKQLNSSAHVSPLANSQRRNWQITILIPCLTLMNLRYLMEQGEGRDWALTNEKAWLVWNGLKKKRLFIFVTILLCSFMGRSYKYGSRGDGKRGLAGPIRGRAGLMLHSVEWSAAALTECLPIQSSRLRALLTSK